MKSLEAAIEKKRSELNKYGHVYGLNSEQVLRKSLEIDVLLNQYYAIKRTTTETAKLAAY